MINHSLQLFCNRTVAAGAITGADVADLGRAILPDGFTSREDADMLIALERAVPAADAAFGDHLVTMLVDFAVWGERPSGHVDADVARWLAASLGNGTGPTRLAARAAFEIVREAHVTDERFVAFTLAANARRLAQVEADPVVALAA